MSTECLEGYVHMLEILVTKYGIPENICCNKHTISISPIDGNLIQFSHMCEDLGINIIAANTPQAKGKVEKWNNTIQDRLINDIKRYNITSLEKYIQLVEEWTEFYNTTRIKGKKINKKKGYKKNDK